MTAPLTETPLTRRLAAVAFADLVGWSVLAGADESRAAARWMALFRGAVAPAAEAEGGRIVDVQGDGTLAEFPDPAAALAWARRLHAAAETASAASPEEPPFAFRVAIHLGAVLVAGERILGETVNLAARLQEYATPGGTVLSAEAAAALPEGAREGARELGELPLRNLSRSVRAISLDPRGAVAVPLAPPPTLLPSVAVLPLENQGGDPRDDYLAAGVVEDIAASLAGLHEVFVIAPESARMFLGQSPTPQRVGRTLGVRFAVMGGMRRLGGGFRASVRLVDTLTGEQLWGERIDGADRELFEVQEHLVARVVAGVAPNIRAAALREAMRKRPESLTAYDHMLRGVHAMALQDREAFRAAREHLDLAMRSDDGFALPVAWAARWHILALGVGWSEDRAADVRAALRLSQAALAKESNNGLALAVAGHAAGSYLRDIDTGADRLRRALEVSPGNPQAWMWSSGLMSYLGRGEEAVAQAERSLRLSPYDPMRFMNHHFLSIARYVAGDLEGAAGAARVSLGDHPPHASAWRTFAASLAGLGRREEARGAVRRMVELEPGFSLDTYLRTRIPYRDRAVAERFARDLRAAGAPD